MNFEIATQKCVYHRRKQRENRIFYESLDKSFLLEIFCLLFLYWVPIFPRNGIFIAFNFIFIGKNKLFTFFASSILKWYLTERSIFEYIGEYKKFVVSLFPRPLYKHQLWLLFLASLDFFLSLFMLCFVVKFIHDF